SADTVGAASGPYESSFIGVPTVFVPNMSPAAPPGYVGDIFGVLVAGPGVPTGVPWFAPYAQFAENIGGGLSASLEWSVLAQVPERASLAVLAGRPIGVGVVRRRRHVEG